LSTIKKDPIFLDESKEVVLEKASCYKDVTVKKYDLLSLSSKQVEDIVDEKVKELVKER
jgi:CRISPR-associated endonuclease Csn1